MKIITVGSYLCHLVALIWFMPLLGGREAVHSVWAMDRKDEKKDDEKKSIHSENLRSSDTSDSEEEKEKDEKEEKRPCQNGVDKKSKKKGHGDSGAEPSAPKEEDLEKEKNEDKEKEGELEEVKIDDEEEKKEVEKEDEGKDEDEENKDPSGAISKLKSAIRKISCIDSMRSPSMMSGEGEEQKEEEQEKEENEEGEVTDGESLKSAFKPVVCMEQTKLLEEYSESVGVSVPDGPVKEEEGDKEDEGLEKDELDEEEEEKKEVEDADRNNIVEGPELLTAAILGPDYKNIEKPAILINIWPLESRESEKVAKILSLELVDEAKMMGSYYRIKVEGSQKGKSKGKGIGKGNGQRNEGVPLLVNKGAGDEVLKIKERQFKFITEIRSDEIPRLKRKMSVVRSGACQIPSVKTSAFDLDFPREMVGEDELDEIKDSLLKKRKEMTNPFKEYYHRFGRYWEVEDSTPSEKMTPESDMSSSLGKSGSSRGIGILMGEFSEEDMGEPEMSEEEMKLLAEEIYYE